MKCKYCQQEVLPNEPQIADHPTQNKSHLKCFKRWQLVGLKESLDKESSSEEPSSF